MPGPRNRTTRASSSATDSATSSTNGPGTTASAAATPEQVRRFVAASRDLLGMAVRSINAAEVPVTVPQHRVLVLLSIEGSLAIGELADELGVDQSNASRLCDRLQRLALVERSRSQEDARRVEVSLTDQGARVVDEVDRRRRREVAAVLAKLSPEARELAARGMEEFSSAAHHHADGPDPEPEVGDSKHI